MALHVGRQAGQQTLPVSGQRCVGVTQQLPAPARTARAFSAAAQRPALSKHSLVQLSRASLACRAAAAPAAEAESDLADFDVAQTILLQVSSIPRSGADPRIEVLAGCCAADPDVRSKTNLDMFAYFVNLL